MRPAALEAKVLAAVGAVRSGVSPEDDFTECKARWPEKRTARQLAGLVNKAAGEPVIYIIGIHDRTGAVMDPGDVDPADWWAGMRGQFDQTPPDVLLHMQIAIGVGEHVHAWAFDSSRAPYVVKTEGSSVLDVPFRDGTATRSAHRHELLLMLLPTVNTPPASLLSANLAATWEAGDPGRDDSGYVTAPLADHSRLSGKARIFVEHIGPSALMLPRHGMRAAGRLGMDAWPLEPYAHAPRSASPYGVNSTGDGLVVTGPGTFEVQVSGDFSLDRIADMEAAHEVTLTLEFDVVGSRRPVQFVAILPKDPAPLQAMSRGKYRTVNHFYLEN